jgi:hypothetical protein
MDPIKTNRSNFVYKGPTPDIGDLACERTTESGTPVVYSVWEPSEEERRAIAEGGYVKLGIWGMEPIPPVSVRTIKNEEKLT